MLPKQELTLEKERKYTEDNQFSYIQSQRIPPKSMSAIISGTISHEHQFLFKKEYHCSNEFGKLQFKLL